MYGLGCTVYDLGCRVNGVRLRVHGVRFRVQPRRFRVQPLWPWAYHSSGNGTDQAKRRILFDKFSYQ